MSVVARAISRYYCTRVPAHRVFPYDGFEKLTEAPVHGKSGEAVLLSSLNSGLAPDDLRWGWCWACNQWVQCFKRTQHELMRDYLARTGVSIRTTTDSVEGKRLRAAQSAAKRAKR